MRERTERKAATSELGGAVRPRSSRRWSAQVMRCAKTPPGSVGAASATFQHPSQGFRAIIASANSHSGPANRASGHETAIGRASPFSLPGTMSHSSDLRNRETTRKTLKSGAPKNESQR